MSVFGFQRKTMPWLAFFKQALGEDPNAIGKNVSDPFTSNPKMDNWQKEKIMVKLERLSHIDCLLNKTFHSKYFGIAFQKHSEYRLLFRLDRNTCFPIFYQENVSIQEMVMTSSITLKVFLLKCQKHASNLT